MHKIAIHIFEPSGIVNEQPRRLDLDCHFRKLELPEVFYRGKRLPLARWPDGEAFSLMEKVTDNGMNPPHAP